MFQQLDQLTQEVKLIDDDLRRVEVVLQILIILTLKEAKYYVLPSQVLYVV